MIARVLAALLAFALLSIGTSACGGATASHSSTTVKRDRDNDLDHNDDDAQALDWGHAAGPADRATITSLLTRYYAAAAAEEGATTCHLLMPFMAEAVAEDYGHNTETPGHSCAAVMRKLFALRHQLLVIESASLKIYAMRVGEGKALTFLTFATLPEVREITERRDGSEWKVLELLDQILE